MTAEHISDALNGRRCGTGYKACCPAHEDKNPSLSITDGENGVVLVYCHAGCSQEAVIAALKGLGLWPERESTFTRIFHYTPPSKSDVVSKIVATYNYADEDGKLLYQTVRKEPKDFFQRRPDGAGGWELKKGERQVLYHLVEVLHAPVVFVVEGEKDADAMRSHGFVATTNAGGAKVAWLPQFTEALAGRDVIVIPDNDGPGWKHAAVIVKAIVGRAKRVRVLDLPVKYKDVSDFFAAGHSELELMNLLEDPDGA